MSLRRATGQAAFAGDLLLPGTLHLALRRSPVAHARVVRADATRAVSLPGVAAVLAGGDEGSPLASVLRFVGDRLAVAAAEEPELARRAVDLVELELEPLPPILDAEAAAGDEASVAARVSASTGDVEVALAGAAQVVEGEWSLPFTPAVPLEPPVAVTWFDEDRRLVVRTSAESPFRVRSVLADRLSLPAARIRVVRPLVAGGSFGRSQLVVEDLCAAVTLRTGRPARLSLSAEEELTTTPGRPAQRVRLRLGATGGRLVALEVRLLVDLGADREEGAADLLRSCGRHALGLYRIPHLRFEATAVHTNRPPASAPRGADAGAAFAVECAMDEVAALLGEDATALRGRHLRSPGDPAGQALPALGEPDGQGDVRAVAELLRAGPGDAGRAPRWRSASDGGPLRQGSGIGVARRAEGREGGAAASLRLLDDGSFTLAAGPSAAGGLDEAAYSEAAAAILGVTPHRVVCAAADTDSAPFESGDVAPAYFSAGRAVEEAARVARTRIREAGAGLLGILEADATVDGGHVRDAKGRAVSFAEIGAATLRAGQPLVVTAAPAPAARPPSLAAAFADVEVDTETGVVRVTRLAAALAAGPFADTRSPEGQVEGALADALEQALAGGLTFDAEGRPRVRALRRWPLVAAMDVPPLSVTFLAAGDPLSRFGAAALGEAASRAALAAIVNAVSQATGARLRELPLSPTCVLDALTSRGRP